MPKKQQQPPTTDQHEAPAAPAVLAERENRVYELLLAGANSRQIKATIEREDEKNPDKAWGVSERTIDRYIATAKGYLNEAASINREFELGRAVNRLHDLYARAIKFQDIKGAVSVQRELNQLLALYAPPAAQTIRLEGGDMDTLKVMIDAMNERGIKPSEMFESMMAIIAADHDKPNG